MFRKFFQNHYLVGAAAALPAVAVIAGVVANAPFIVVAVATILMFASMREAYYIQKQSGSSLTPATLLHLATHSGSEILGRNQTDSCFTPGLPADFVVVKWRNSALLAQRLENAQTDNDRLFATIILGDDRIVNATYVGGKKVYDQPTH